MTSTSARWRARDLPAQTDGQSADGPQEGSSSVCARSLTMIDGEPVCRVRTEGWWRGGGGCATARWGGGGRGGWREGEGGGGGGGGGVGRGGGGGGGGGGRAAQSGCLRKESPIRGPPGLPFPCRTSSPLS